jgi:hypothetical protein
MVPSTIVSNFHGLARASSFQRNQMFGEKFREPTQSLTTAELNKGEMQKTKNGTSGSRARGTTCPAIDGSNSRIRLSTSQLGVWRRMVPAIPWPVVMPIRATIIWIETMSG